MLELQRSNIASDTSQQSRADIQRMQNSSRARHIECIQRQNERMAEQERALQATNARLEEWERMVRDLSEFDEINRLLITRYQEHEDREVDLDDKENKLIGWCRYFNAMRCRKL